MNDEVEPIVGNWYKREDDDEMFTVVSVDKIKGVIEIRPLDGEVEEMDPIAWEELTVELIDDPDEWEDDLDESAEDDVDYDEDDDDEDEDEDEEDDDDWGDEFSDRE